MSISSASGEQELGSSWRRCVTASGHDSVGLDRSDLIGHHRPRRGPRSSCRLGSPTARRRGQPRPVGDGDRCVRLDPVGAENRDEGPGLEVQASDSRGLRRVARLVRCVALAGAVCAQHAAPLAKQPDLGADRENEPAGQGCRRIFGTLKLGTARWRRTAQRALANRRSEHRSVSRSRGCPCCADHLA